MSKLQRLVKDSVRLMIAAFLIANTPLVFPAPFTEQISFTQPDGTQIQLNGHGDEFYAVFETLDGYSVVFDRGSKAYCYATAAVDGQLASTGVQVQTAS